MKLIEDRTAAQFRHYKSILSRRDWTSEREIIGAKRDTLYLEDGNQLVAVVHRNSAGKYERVLEVVQCG